MNYVIYLSLFVCFFSLCVSFIAIARVAKWQRSVHDLDWEALAALIGDVGAVKKSITRLNGRLNGMDNATPNYDWEQQIAEHYASKQNGTGRIGG